MLKDEDDSSVSGYSNTITAFWSSSYHRNLEEERQLVYLPVFGGWIRMEFFVPLRWFSCVESTFWETTNFTSIVALKIKGCLYS